MRVSPFDSVLLPTRAQQQTLHLSAVLWVLILGSGVLLRFLHLGQFVTSDEANFWMERSALFLGALQQGEYASTAIASHPGVTTMWLGGAGLLLSNTLESWGWLQISDFSTRLALMQLPVAVVHASGLLLTAFMLRRIFSEWVALLATCLIAYDPFLIGYSRLLHVDALAGTGITISLLAAYMLWHHERRWRWALLSGAAAAFAILSKSPALLLLPTIFVIALAAPRELAGPSWWQCLVVWGAACLVALLIGWPALWADPVACYQLVRFGVEGEGAQPHALGNFFLGREDLAPGFSFYPVALIMRLTPLSLIGLILLVVVLPALRESQRRDFLVLLGFALLFLLVMGIFPKKFNRYLIPVIGLFDMLAALGWAGALLLLLQSCRAAWHSLIRHGVLIGVIMAAWLNAAAWEPYPISAYNQLFGGHATGAQIFLTGWGEGMEQVADWLNQQPDSTGVVIATTQAATLQPYLNHGVQSLTPADHLPAQTGYVVIYHRDTQPRPLPPFDQYYQRMPAAKVVTIHGVEYAWIYQVPPAVPQPSTAQFGAGLELRGYDIVNQADRQTAQLDLFWYTKQALTSDYAIFVHVIGEDGTRYTQRDPIYPTSQWGVNRYPITRIELPLPPAAANQNLQFVVGVYEPTSGARLPLSGSAAADPQQAGPEAILLVTLPSQR
ncbi:MAG: hypothetical protein Fur005_45610 [Roseiflexaceae bacterium]